MSHHLLSEEEFRTSDPTSVIETVVLDDPEFDETAMSAMDVQAEILTKFAAVEFLFPFSFRIQRKRESVSTYKISAEFNIPENLVQAAMTKKYMDFSVEMWGLVSALRDGRIQKIEMET